MAGLGPGGGCTCSLWLRSPFPSEAFGLAIGVCCCGGRSVCRSPTTGHGRLSPSSDSGLLVSGGAVSYLCSLQLQAELIGV